MGSLGNPTLEQKVPGKIVLSVCVSVQILKFDIMKWIEILFYIVRVHLTDFDLW
jgi:hypothetical protein